MIRIAIDGPGGAGKSTVAKRVAKELNIEYVDTGAMYRSVAYKILTEGIDADKEELVEALMDGIQLTFVSGKIHMDGKILDEELRSPQVSQMASRCSKLKVVREKLVGLQRQIGMSIDVVMDGRDIGTNVIKDAEYKFYLNASPEVRAERRYNELKERGMNTSYDDILIDINHRDKNDMERELNPLKKADDATEIDSSYMNIDQVVRYILDRVSCSSVV